MFIKLEVVANQDDKKRTIEEIWINTNDIRIVECVPAKTEFGLIYLLLSRDNELWLTEKGYEQFLESNRVHL